MTYDGSLHLKILDKVIKAAPNAEIVNLSPIRWLQDPLAEYKKNSDWFRFENIRKHIENVDVVSQQDSYKYFNAYMDQLGIYTIKPNAKGYETDNAFAKKIVDHIEKNYDDYASHKKTSFWVPVAKFKWTSNGMETFEPFTLLFSENGTYAKSGWTKGLHDTYEIFYFDTKEELDNFKSFMQRKSYKWILGHLLVGKRLPTRFIPFMPTYTHPWTDEMLYEYFGLTEDEIKEIVNIC